MSQPLFLPLGRAQSLINVTNRSQMQNLFGLLPHLYFKARQTRLFSADYLTGLAGFLAGRSATLQLVRQYNATDEARRRYLAGVTAFSTAVAAKSEFTPTEVADLLNVGRATVSGWVGAKVLPYTEKRLHRGEIVPMGPRQRRVQGRQFIAADTLRERFVWVAPF